MNSETPDPKEGRAAHRERWEAVEIARDGTRGAAVDLPRPPTPVKELDDLLRAAAELQSAIGRRGWRYCFIGGVAVQRWGNPRFTQDIDLTLFTGLGSEEPSSMASSVSWRPGDPTRPPSRCGIASCWLEPARQWTSTWLWAEALRKLEETLQRVARRLGA